MSTELLDQDRLRRALAQERPDPEAFLAGVRGRVARAEAAWQAEQLRLQEAPAPLRVAAGVLPPGLISAGLAVGSLGTKKLGAKALPGLLSLPVVSLLMLFAGFGIALLGLFRKQEPSEGSYSTRQEAIVFWWRRNLKPAIASLVVLVLLVAFQYSELLLLVLLGSMAVAVLQVGHLARSGFTSPKAVGGLCAQLLMNLSFYGWMLRGLFGSSPNYGAMVTLLFVGGLVCLAFTGILTWSRTKEVLWTPIAMKHPDPVTDWSLRLMLWLGLGVASLVALVATLFLALQLRPLARGPQSVRTAIEQVRGQRDGFDARAFEAAARGVEVLIRHGEALPDLATLREVLQVPKEQEPDLGYEGRLLGYPVEAPPVDERLFVRNVQRMWDRVQRLDLAQTTPELRQQLAAHVLSIQTDDEYVSFEELVRVTRLLGDLEHKELLGPLREKVVELLERRWSPHGGFSRYEQEERGWLHRISPDLSMDVEASEQAVELMSLHGVPASIDLALLRSCFLGKARRLPWSLQGDLRRRDDLYARLGLFQLERLPEYRPASLTQRLQRNRNLVAAALLVALCLIATIQSRRGGQR